MLKFMLFVLSLSLSVTNNSYAQFARDLPQQEDTEELSSVFIRSQDTEQEPETFQQQPVSPQPQKPANEPVRIYAPGDVKIIAIVNGEILSSADIEERAKAFVMNTGIPFNAETKKMIIAKVIQTAIDEKLKIQEAQRQGLDITEKDIDASIKVFEQNNNIPEGKLKSKLAKSGVSMDVFREQIKSDIAWIRVVRKQMMSEGSITNADVEESINQSAKDMSTPKYMVSEIVIKKPNAKNLEGLVANLRRDPRFELYAAQFSESPSASNGGNLGWLNKGQLVEPLNSKVLSMKEGEISDAIQVGENFYIMKLAQIYDPKKDKPNLPTKEEMRKFLENKKLEEVSAKYLHNVRQRAVIELRD